MINKYVNNNLLSNNYTTYTPHGTGLKSSSHGFNGELAYNNKNNNKYYLLGNRLYFCNIGIFNQKDSLNISNGGAINTYTYANHNPINNHDPSGNSSTGFYAGNIIGLVAGVTGVILAIPTGGASLTITAGTSIAIESAEIVATTASVTLMATDNPNSANIAGWISAGLGLSTLGVGGATAVSSKLTNASSITSSIAESYSISLTSHLALSSRSTSLSSLSSSSTREINFNISARSSIDLQSGPNRPGVKNNLGFLETDDFSQKPNREFIYRLDQKNAEQISAEGFSADTNFAGIPQMIEGDSLLVFETIQGAFNFMGSGYINPPCSFYRINASNIRGASLNDNLESNFLNTLNIIGDLPAGILSYMSAHVDVVQANKAHFEVGLVNFLGSV